MIFFLQFVCALALDIIFGDPEWFPHPVRIIGKFCTWYESLTRQLFSSQLTAGFITVILVICSTFLSLAFILYIAFQLSPIIGSITAVFFLYTTVAMRDLLKHSRDVYHALTSGDDLSNARMAVGRIVGRDTTQLDESGVTRACVETVAENMVDGITAPIFYACVGAFISSFLNLPEIYGAALGAMVYKSVNTMDSMFGYKNDKYLLFGRFAARLDDVVNWLPARLSGFYVIFAAFFSKLDYRKAAMVYKRDRKNHSSPNAAHTEAAIAGALKIRLGGPSFYFGKEVVKPYIGDNDQPVKPEHILLANKVVLTGSLLFFCSLMLIGGLF